MILSSLAWKGTRAPKARLKLRMESDLSRYLFKGKSCQLNQNDLLKRTPLLFYWCVKGNASNLLMRFFLQNTALVIILQATYTGNLTKQWTYYYNELNNLQKRKQNNDRYGLNLKKESLLNFLFNTTPHDTLNEI